MTNIQKVYTAHTINTIALSVLSVYVPAYLLTIGFPLWRVILFFVIAHGVGLVFSLFLFPFLMKSFGLLNTFKFYYPLQTIYLLLLSFLKLHTYSLELVAIFYGLAVFAYFMPLNIFFIKHSDFHEMGNNLSKFFALPSLFSILGPLLGAIFIPHFGFWPVFIFTIVGICTSFIPLASISEKEIVVTFTFSSAWNRLLRNKTLFLFEFFDNIIEESEWFWAIYVFLIIGTLSTPGYVGSLEAIGGSLVTLFIGRYVNRFGKKLIPVIASLLFVATVVRIFIHQAFFAYVVTVVASLLLNIFLVVYFSTIYKTVKHNNEEEFMILREISTVFGRMAVFAVILITIPFLRFFFILPSIVITLLLILYFFKRKLLVE